MFAYLSKKIAIPNNKQLKSLAWSSEHGYIACGGEDGLLKILKLEAHKADSAKGLAAPTNLAMNQTLEGHSGVVQVITWNEQFEKVTSADERGLIIVWMLYKGNWYEEMINNRNKSTVRGLRWDKEGRRICIAYEDGAVIVGSVDGNRIWGKEIKCSELACVEWASHGRSILFGLSSGEIHIYDSLGIFLNKLPIYCLTDVHGAVSLVGVTWYRGEKGYYETDCPVLAVCYDVGRCQIMRNEHDASPVLLDAGIQISCVSWNENGSILAVGGQQKFLPNRQPDSSSDKSIGVVQFYNPLGDHLHTLNVPGRQPSACAWEGNGSLRLALAIDSFIYFTNLRLTYHWTYCQSNNTLVYAFIRTETQERCVMFWNTKRSTTCIQPVENLLGIAGGDEYCCLASKFGPAGSLYRIDVYNSLGSILDTKTIKVEPKFLAMAGNYVVIASHSLIYVWQFKNPKQLFGFGTMIKIRNKQREGLERLCHIDQRDKTGNQRDEDSIRSSSGPDLSLLAAPISENPIVAITAHGNRNLFVARSNGEVVRYRLPDLWFESSFQATDKRPVRIESNCDANIIGLIDEQGVLSLHDIPEMQDDGSLTFIQISSKLDTFLRKDVWDLRFSYDDPNQFVAMEKTKMLIFSDLEAEPAVQTSAYIASFHDLEVLCILLDDLVQQGDQPQPDVVSSFPTKSLNDCKRLLDDGLLEKAKTMIEAAPHPRLWRIIAESALENQNLDDAEVAFVYCQYFPGIDFVKKLRNIQSETVRKAEIKAYFSDFEGAERLFLNADRCDLAIELRKRLGDWFRVAELAKESGVVVRDQELAEVWNSIGDHYFGKQHWSQAAEFYKQGSEHKKRIRCLYLLEDYNALETIIGELPEGHSLLPELAQIFSGIGLAHQAVVSLMKCGQFKEAIDVCLELNEWQLALDIIPSVTETIEAANIKKRIANQLRSCTVRLLDQGRIIQAIELLKRAGHFLDAAKLMFRETKMAEKDGCSPGKLKKMYVLVGLLVEKHHERSKYQSDSQKGDAASQDMVTGFQSMLMGDYVEDEKEVDTLYSQSFTDMPYASTVATLPQDTNSGGGRGDRHHHQAENEAAAIRNSGASMSQRLAAHFGSMQTCDITHLIDQPWRGADAYHFLMLAQNQLYAGLHDQALRCALLLRDYDDIINPVKVYSLIALCAVTARSFATASKAFIKLQNLNHWLPKERKNLDDLAVSIFSRYPPKTQIKSTSCLELDMMLESETKIPICAVTGQPVTDYQFWMCPTCKHSAYETEIARMRNCPLCHFPVQ